MKLGIRTLTAVLVLTCAFVTVRADAQDANLEPIHGTVELKAGFERGFFTRDLEAGGPIPTNKGGVNAYVAEQPGFVLDYTAGNSALTIYAESKADTTLLIMLPDGHQWKANDDGPGTGLNPLLRFENPQSGRYTIWVGTVGKKQANATLMITETKEWNWHSKFPFDSEIKNNDIEDIMALSGLGASTLGLLGSPEGQGRLLAASALTAVRPDVIGRHRPCKAKRDNVRGAPYEEYEVQFTKDRTYEISMRADARTFFPCLRLEDSGGRQVKSASSRDRADDGSGSQNATACITYFCRETGKFKVIATNYSGTLGTFDVKVREDAPFIYEADNEFMDKVIPNHRLTRTGPKDSVLRKSPCKTFLFRFKHDVTYEIELLTQGPGTFDAVLRLEDDAGQELAFNDDWPAELDGITPVIYKTDSRITFACKSDRTYRVIATSLNAYYHNTAGDPNLGCGYFTLTVRKLINEFTRDDVKEHVTRAMGAKFVNRSEVSFVGKPFTAPAEEADKEKWSKATVAEWNQKGKMFRARRLQGGEVYLDATIIFVDGISLAKLENGHTQARREQIEFGMFLNQPKILQVDLTDGKPINGQFKKDDPQDPINTGWSWKVYEVTLAKGTTYQIDMKSEKVDSFLGLYDAAGKFLDENDDGDPNDDGPGRFNAKLVFKCPADGTYRIVATTAQRIGVTRVPFGDYTLTVSEKQ